MKRTLCRDFRLSVQLSPFWFFASWTLAALASSDNWLHLLMETTELCFGFLTHNLLTFTRQQTRTIVKLTLLVFCLRDHCSSLLDIQCLKKSVSGITALHCLTSNVLKTVTEYILPCFLLVTAGRINLVPVTPSCLEVEVRTMDFNSCISSHRVDMP